MKNILKKGSKIIVTTGKDKGKKGEIIKINKKLNGAIVKGINLYKKHMKTTKEKKGGIIQKEGLINLSNLKLESPSKSK